MVFSKPFLGSNPLARWFFAPSPRSLRDMIPVLKSFYESMMVKLAEKDLIAATNGNVSCRAGEGSLLVTPSGKPKGGLKSIDLLLLNLHGEVLAGREKPSSEIRMHLEVYRRRADVAAIVHAHPPMLTAFTLAGIPFLSEALPEVYITKSSDSG